jgi:hypothetical protein
VNLLTSVRSLAIDSSAAYWTCTYGDIAATGTVSKVPLSGGPSVVLAADQGFPQGIAVDSSNVYWLNDGVSADGSGPPIRGGSVMAVPIGGGSPTVIAPSQPEPQAIAADGSSIYWTCVNGPYDGGPEGAGLVMSLSVKAGTVTVLESAQFAPFAIAVDRASVYWTDLGVTSGEGSTGTLLQLTPK